MSTAEPRYDQPDYTRGYDQRPINQRGPGEWGPERHELGGWVVPEGTAAQASQLPPPVPSMTDQLRMAAEPPPWPEGAPELRPLMSLPFAERADAMDMFDGIRQIAEDFPAKGTQIGPAEAAKMYRALARLDDFLMVVAADKTAYANWPGRHDDARFSELWSVYEARMQPGEAPSSSS